MPFGTGTGKWQISSSGANQPVWRRDGKELFYWTPDNDLISVPIALKAGLVEAGAAHSLFRFNSPLNIFGLASPYDVSADGQRFVLITTPRRAPQPVTLVTNWVADLKR